MSDYVVMFADDSSECELQAINTDFTFELFICAAILLENRDSLLQCRDDVQLIQFTSRFVFMLRHKIMIIKCGNLCVGETFAVLCSLQGTLDLNSTLKKAELHFYNYCKCCSWGYMNVHCRAQKSKEEDFLYQLRSLFLLR